MPSIQQQIDQLNIERRAIEKTNAEIRNQTLISRSRIELYEQEIANERLKQITNADLMRENQKNFEAAGKKLASLIIKIKS